MIKSLITGLLFLAVVSVAKCDPIVIYPDDTTACVLSPYNWAPDPVVPHAVKSWNNGAYARFYVTQCSAPVIVKLKNGTVDVKYTYQIDNGPVNAAHGTSIKKGNAIYITLPDNGSHTITVRVHEVPQVSGRFAGKEFLGIISLTLPEGGIKGKAKRGSKNLLIFGDSITEGIFADDWTDTIYHSNLYTWAYYVSEALALADDFEYGIMACGGGGYSVDGAGECPPAITVGNDSQTWWNKVNVSTSQLNIKNLFSRQPDIIIENWGTNDQAAAHYGEIYQNRIASLWKALRKAAPNALIIKVYTFLGYYKSDIEAAVKLYQTKPDPKFKTIDLHVEARREQYGMHSDPYYSGVHPGIWGHAVYGSLIGVQVQKLFDSK